MNHAYSFTQGQQNSSDWYYQTYLPQPKKLHQLHIGQKNSKSVSDSSLKNRNNEDLKTLSNGELIKLLNAYTKKLAQLCNQDQETRYPTFIPLISQLHHLPKLTLVSVAQNDFFSSLEIPMRHLIRRWRLSSTLSNVENAMFSCIVKLLKKLVKYTDDISLLPSWFSGSTFLKLIADCLNDIGTAGKFLDGENNSSLKILSRLLDAYVRYQNFVNREDVFNKDIFVMLLDPIMNCLTSSYYTDSFINASQEMKSLSTIEKFFLLKCPVFLTSYNGYRLEQTMKNLLSTMLPQYTNLLGKIAPSANKWKPSMIRSVRYLIEIINHGSKPFQTNTKIISEHSSLIDSVMILLNEQRLYKCLDDTLSNSESILINSIINLLINTMKDPTILARIKQLNMAPTLLRLISCQYEPLVINLYTLLASTAHEEDIKAMKNPGRLLDVIIKSLQTALNQTPIDQISVGQLLETLKGLGQHDQIKDEIIHQNTLPFLLECEGKLRNGAHVLILEILWSLSFREDGARGLRENAQFLEKIQTIAKDANDELLKKVADGLVWKLIHEPAFLDKLAKREAEKSSTDTDDVEIVEEIINSDGTKELVTRTVAAGKADAERTFPYDIMISYCHADKELTYKIHKFLLNQGFKVWIDLDNMHGPAMSAMAEAVESSEFVIMCMTESYKQSTYCQAEAEYAFGCKRRLLPLIMKQGYKPDGWLGFMIGSRIYVDFGLFDFDTACQKLMTEITLQRKRPLPAKPGKVAQHEIPTETKPEKPQEDEPNTAALSVYVERKPAAYFTRKFVTDWTDSDVLDFLASQNMIDLMPICEKMDGLAFMELYKMGRYSPSQTYMILNDELSATYKKRLPMSVYTRFLSSVEKKLAERPLTPGPAEPNELPRPRKQYDLVITSNASSQQLIKALGLFGPGLQKIM